MSKKYLNRLIQRYGKEIEGPITRVIGGIVVVSVLTAGFMQILSQNARDNLQASHEREIFSAKQEHISNVNILEKTIDELRLKFSMVENKAGPKNSNYYYFDLSQILIDEWDVRNYIDKYKWALNSNVGIAVTNEFAWKIGSTNRADLNSLRDLRLFPQGEVEKSSKAPIEAIDTEITIENFGDWLRLRGFKGDYAGILAQLRGTSLGEMLSILLSKEVLLWHDEKLYDVLLHNEGIERARMKFNAHIAVWLEDKEFYSKLLNAELLPPPQVTNGTNSVPDNRDKKQDNLSRMSFIFEEMETSMVSLFAIFGDLVLNSSSFKVNGLDWGLNIKSFQKYKNLVYVSCQQVIRNAQKNTDGTFSDVYIDNEFFIVGRKRDVVVIKTTQHSFSPRIIQSSAIQSWLMGLKIPLK